MSSKNKSNRLAAGILIGILIGVAGLYLAGMLVQAPAYHVDIERATTILVQWPSGSPTNVYLTPSLLSSRQGLVGTPLRIDVTDIVTRTKFYNTTMPESIWAWSLNGTVCAVMRVLGPLVVGSYYGNVWYVEISRLTMMQLTIYLPDGTSEVMPMAFGATTPLTGYTVHFYYISSTGFQELS